MARAWAVVGVGETGAKKCWGEMRRMRDAKRVPRIQILSQTEATERLYSSDAEVPSVGRPVSAAERSLLCVPRAGAEWSGRRLSAECLGGFLFTDLSCTSLYGSFWK